MKKIDKKRWVLIIIAVGIIMVCVYRPQKTVYYPMKGFSNMCPYNETVYSGGGGPYGEPIVQESSIFTIQNDQVYYVEKVLGAFESMTDELLAIKCADIDGSNQKVLAEDVFLAGSGHEKLAGNKLFYGYEYDENYRMRYAYVDTDSGKRKKIKSERIDQILGYDGNYIYYNGYDTKKDKNVLGRIYLKSGKDEMLISYPQTDEEGYIDTVSFYDGKFYCLTLKTKTQGYDYRTYEYVIQVRNGKNGEMEYEIPLEFSGSSNYSFLIHDGKMFATLNGNLIQISIDGSDDSEIIGSMKADEYWGILHFVSEDGYLYYEAIAEVNPTTGNNDYFYRIPIDGGESELLNEWFTF